MAGQANNDRINVPLPEKLREQVDQLAVKNYTSSATICRAALRQFVGKECEKPTKK